MAFSLFDASHYRIQYRLNTNWTIRMTVQWNFDLNKTIFIQENVLENFTCKILSILLRPQCVKTSVKRVPERSPISATMQETGVVRQQHCGITSSKNKNDKTHITFPPGITLSWPINSIHLPFYGQIFPEILDSICFERFCFCGFFFQSTQHSMQRQNPLEARRKLMDEFQTKSSLGGLSSFYSTGFS